MITPISNASEQSPVFDAKLPEYLADLVQKHIRPFLTELALVAESILPQYEDQERRNLRMMLVELNQHHARLETDWPVRVRQLTSEAWQLLRSPKLQVHSLSLDNMALDLQDDSVMQEQVIAWRLASNFEERLQPVISSYRGRLAALLECDEIAPDTDPFRPSVVMRGLLQATRILNWGDPQWQLLARLVVSASSGQLAGWGGASRQQINVMDKIYADFDRLLESRGLYSKVGLFTIVRSPDARTQVLEKIDDRLVHENTLLGASRALSMEGFQQIASPGALGAPGLPKLQDVPAVASAIAAPLRVEEARERLLQGLCDMTRFPSDARQSNATPNHLGLTPGDFEPGRESVLGRFVESWLADIPVSARGEIQGLCLALTALFDWIFAQTELCPAVCELLGKLQFPILQIALTDPDFSAQDLHPARQLLNQLGDIALATTDEEFAKDTTLVHLSTAIDDLAKQPDWRGTSLHQAQVLVDTWQQLRRVRLQQRVQQIAELAAEEDKKDAAQFLAVRAVESLLKVRPCPFWLAQFFRDYWVGYVRGQILAYGAENEAKWRRAVHVAEWIAWSVQAKSTLEERKTLTEQLPKTLQRFARGLDMLSFTGALRTELLDKLELEHVRAMHGQPIPEGDLYRAPPVEIPPRGAIGVNEGEQNPARTAWLATLQIGTWYEMLNEEQRLERYTLAWVGDPQSRLYLANRKALRGCLLTPEEFSHRLNHGSARMLASGTLIEQAFQRLFTNLAQGKAPLSGAASGLSP